MKIRVLEEKRRRAQSGSTIIFVAGVLLPVMFFLFSISLDVAEYFTVYRKTQIALDEAALAAHRYLPYTTAAEAAVEGHLARYGDLANLVTVAVSSDSVALQYNASVKLTFASYFGAGLEVPVQVTSRTRGTPFDVLLLMDTASYLSPDLPTGAPWGSNPAAQFFETVYPISYNNNGSPQQIDPVLATQQCFNPIFSALKLSLIRTYQYLSASQLNAIGVGVFPANGTFFEKLKPVTPVQPAGSPSDVQFTNYTGGYVRPDYCAAAAEYELNFPSYRFPGSAQGLGGLWTPQAGAPVSLVQNQNGYTYDPVYQPYLSVRETIWSQVTRGNTNYTPDTAQVLQGVRAELASAPVVTERSGLMNRPVRSAVLFAGDLPWVASSRFVQPDGSIDPAVDSALRMQLQGLRDDALNFDLHSALYYVVFEHTANQTQFLPGAQALEALFHSYQLPETASGGSFRAHVLYGTNLDVLRHDLTSLIGLDKKGAVLAK